jgi:hypothetical protein
MAREWDWLVRYHGLLFSGWSVGWWFETGRQSSMVDQGTKRIYIALRDDETATGDSERVDTAAYSRLKEEVGEGEWRRRRGTRMKGGIMVGDETEVEWWAVAECLTWHGLFCLLVLCCCVV